MSLIKIYIWRKLYLISLFGLKDPHHLYLLEYNESSSLKSLVSYLSL